MVKNYCIVMILTLAYISIFTVCTVVNLLLNENTEKTIRGVAVMSTLEPAKADVSLKPRPSIEEPVEVIPEPEPTIEERLSELSTADIYAEEAKYLAKTIWGEARGCSTTEQAAIVWCVLNRVDDERFPNDIIEVVTQRHQFHGYRSYFPVTDEFYELAIDILGRWELEKAGYEDVGRILPKNYYYFHGDGKHNYFKADYRDTEFWDWSLESPYEDQERR